MNTKRQFFKFLKISALLPLPTNFVNILLADFHGLLHNTYQNMKISKNANCFQFFVVVAEFLYRHIIGIQKIICKFKYIKLPVEKN